jgi:hypothetical protein
VNLDPGPNGEIAGLDAVLNGGMLANAIDAKVDHMASGVRFDLNPPTVAIQDERHSDDCLERVALGAPGRADIGFAR